MREYKILSLPKYDALNDKFVIENEIPNADEHFSQGSNKGHHGHH
jgi:hypothetical protein